LASNASSTELITGRRNVGGLAGGVQAITSMSPRESQVHSFIIKLSVSEVEDEKRKVVWHGYITHVPDAQRRYLTRLSDITAFIATYLEVAGVETKTRPRAKRWLRWLKRGWK
jgi:hypothetical protein